MEALATKADSQEVTPAEITQTAEVNQETPEELKSTETLEDNSQSKEDRSALVAAIPTLDEFNAMAEVSEKEQDTQAAKQNEHELATVTTLDARIEALKEGVSPPA